MRKTLAALAFVFGLAAGASADTVTPRMGVVLLSTGSTNWGTKLNSFAFTVLDSSAAGQFVTNTFISSNTFVGPVRFTSSSATFTGANGFITSGSSITGGAFFGNGANLVGIPSTGSISGGYISNATFNAYSSTITTALATKASTGTDNSMTRAQALKTVDGALTVVSTLTIQGSGGLSATAASFGSQAAGSISTFSANGELTFPNNVGITALNSSGNSFSAVRFTSGNQLRLQTDSPGNAVIIGSNPNTYLTINSGSVTANGAFFGDGSHLYGIPSTGSISGVYLPLAGGTMTGQLVVPNLSAMTAVSSLTVVGASDSAIGIRPASGQAAALDYYNAGTLRYKCGVNTITGGNSYECSDAGGTSRLLIASGGNVGIGSTSPGTTLDVAGGATIRGQETTTSSMTIATAIAGSLPSLASDAGAVFKAASSDAFMQLQAGTYGASPYGTWLQSKDSRNTGAAYQLTINPGGGNVGIGTTNSNTALDVSHTDATTNSNTSLWNLTYGGGLYLENPSSTLNALTGIVMSGGANGYSVGGIATIQEAANSVGALGFYTGGQGTANTVPERARISSVGDFGINNTSPKGRLDIIKQVGFANVGASTGSSVNLWDGTGGVTGGGFIGFGYEGVHVPGVFGWETMSGSGNTSGDFVWLNRNGTTDVRPSEVMRLTSTGLLGIGTASPGSKLQLGASTFSNDQLRIGDVGATNFWYFSRDNVSSGELAIGDQAGERIRIKTTGMTVTGSSVNAGAFFGDGSHLTGVTSSFAGGGVANATTFLSSVTFQGQGGGNPDLGVGKIGGLAGSLQVYNGGAVGLWGPSNSGSFIVRSGTDSVMGIRTTVGGPDIVTITATGNVNFPSVPRVQAATQGSGQVLPNNVDAQCFYQSPVYDTQSMYGTATASGTFTVPTAMAGYYRVHACEVLQSASSVIMRIYINGVATYSAQTYDGSGNTWQWCIDRTPLLAAGDTIKIYALQNSGVTKTTIGTSIANGFIEIAKQ